MSGPDESHRFAVRGRDSDGYPCTLIGYRLVNLVGAVVVRVVVVSVNSTERGSVVLRPSQAIEVADGLRVAAGGSS